MIIEEFKDEGKILGCRYLQRLDTDRNGIIGSNEIIENISLTVCHKRLISHRTGIFLHCIADLRKKSDRGRSSGRIRTRPSSTFVNKLQLGCEVLERSLRSITLSRIPETVPLTATL